MLFELSNKLLQLETTNARVLWHLRGLC